MVNNASYDLDVVFHALSDQTRRAMLERLVRGQCNVSELPNPHGVSKAAISKHLAVLHQARLIEKERSGRKISCSANLDALDPAILLLERLGQFWRGQLDSLERFFEKQHREEKKNGRKNLLELEEE